MNIASALRLCGSQFGGRTALAWGTEAHSTYAEFAERVAFMAGGFIECLGLHTGDRVGIAMSNCPQFLEVLYSVWHAGCVAVPINAKLHPRELAYILQDSGARVCFTTLDLEDTVTPLQDSIPSLECVITVPSQSYEALNHSSLHPMADLPPDDLAWLFYTSGTTGRPLDAKVFMGLCFYQRLHHLAREKCYSRRGGPVDAITKQPLAGRKHGGGLRLGEMEKDVLHSTGAIGVLQERMESIGRAMVAVCPDCSQARTACTCPAKRPPVAISMPHASKMLLMELQSMLIKVQVS